MNLLKVFLGSKKFSRENEFDKFIKNRNGIVNAYTECEHTIFYFQIDNQYLDGALDRFSQLFISPLMTRDGMEREISAINSEFENEKNSDYCRILQLFSTFAHHDHPVSHFAWGNSNSLHLDIDHLYNIVHQFHEKYYKANRMSLCIQSTLSSPVIQPMVTRYFSEIKTEQGTIMKLNSIDPFKDVFQSKFYNKMYFVKSASKKRKLIFTFMIPTKDHQGNYSFLEYLAYLFNNEGKSSLVSYLKRSSLIVQLDTRIGCRDFEDNSMFLFFTIEIILTRQGFDEIDRIVEVIFEYLLIIKITSLEEHQEIYEDYIEVKKSLNLFSKSRNSDEVVQDLTLNMRYSDNDENIVIGRERQSEFDGKIMQNLIGKLNELKFNIIVLSENHRKFDKIERWFGTEFSEIGKYFLINLHMKIIQINFLFPQIFHQNIQNYGMSVGYVMI